MTTYTPEIRNQLAAYLDSRKIPKGIGTEEAACSIAAINLALTGKLTDKIPDCMSLVIGKATIKLQDAMPFGMRNSPRYKAWLITAPGTGRDREKERLAVLINWMWETVLPQIQPLADEKGFGKEWQTMCEQRTAEAVRAAARDAARAAAYAAAYAAYAAAYAAEAAAYAAADAAYAYAAAADAAHAAAHTAEAAYAAEAAEANFWKAVEPIGVLERMTNLETTT